MEIKVIKENKDIQKEDNIKKPDCDLLNEEK